MRFELTEYEDNEKNRLDLFRFYRRVYPDSPWLLDRDRFVWQTCKNPLKDGNSTDIWLLRDDSSEIVGQNIYIRYPLRIDQKNCIGFCSTNLIVQTDMVGKGYGHTLIEKNEKLGGIAYAVGITPASTRAFLKRGWVHVEDSKLMSRFVNIRPNLRYLKVRGLKLIVAYPVILIANLLTSAYRRLTRPGMLDDLSYREIDEFDPTWDETWELYLRGYAIHYRRTAEFLNYKYTKRKDVTHSILLFEWRGKLAGYMVYRSSVNSLRKLRLTRIVDLVCDPSGDWKLPAAMIRVVMDRLGNNTGDGIVGIAPSAEIQKAFRANGLYISRRQPAIIKEKGFSVSKLRLEYENLWYITLGDSDLDNYW